VGEQCLLDLMILFLAGALGFPPRQGLGIGRVIAHLNLWISMPCLFLAFAVWQLWSVVAVNLPAR